MKNFYKNKRILITGHTGFKGAWLSQILLSMGANVYGISLRPFDSRGNLYKILKLKKHMDSNYLDLRDLTKLKLKLKKINPDLIFHLAAQPYVLQSYEKPLTTISSNIIGLVNLLDVSRSLNNLRAILNVTTDKCYENLENKIPFREDDRLGGKDIYSASKACSEILTKSYYQSFMRDLNVNIATARAGNIIGGGDFGENRIVPDLIESVQKNAPLNVRSPESIRPWQHVLDVLNGYMLLMQKTYRNNSEFESFNFAPNVRQVVTVKDIVSKLSKELDFKKVKFKKIKSNKESITLRLNPNKSKKLLGWKCKYSIKECIKITANWYRSYLDNENMKIYSEKQINDFFANSL